jgi:hypothetical protein
MEDHRVARQLRAAGHLVYLPSELSVKGQPDELHLAAATDLGAVIATHNQKHFYPLHREWNAQGRAHAGILLVVQQLDIGSKLASVERAARLLTPELAKNQLMYLKMFETEQRAQLFISSLIDFS